jgi:hypothetical protein
MSRVHWKRQLGRLSGPRDHLLEPLASDWAAPLGHEHVPAGLALALQPSQRSDLAATQRMDAGATFLEAVNVKLPAGKVDHVPAQGTELGSPQAVAVGDQDCRLVSVAVATALAGCGLSRSISFRVRYSRGR